MKLLMLACCYYILVMGDPIQFFFLQSHQLTSVSRLSDAMRLYQLVNNTDHLSSYFSRIVHFGKSCSSPCLLCNLKAKHLVQELTISQRMYEFAVCLGLDFTDILVFAVLQLQLFSP